MVLQGISVKKGLRGYGKKRGAFMKKAVICAVLSLVVFPSLLCAEYVSGYFRKDGTHVSGYNRSESNSTVRDNYSYHGNENPYTGESGSNYYRNNPTSEYYGNSSRSVKPSWKY